jgi:hypothetical protein
MRMISKWQHYCGSDAGGRRKYITDIFRDSNKILRKINNGDEEFNNIAGIGDERAGAQKIQKLEDPRNPAEVATFVASVVLPPLRVDQRSIGGSLFEEYPENMIQETLLCFKCKSFELTGSDHISISCLENPASYAKHKRSLGLFGKGNQGAKQGSLCHFSPIDQPTTIDDRKKRTKGPRFTRSGRGGIRQDVFSRR